MDGIEAAMQVEAAIISGMQKRGNSTFINRLSLPATAARSQAPQHSRRQAGFVWPICSAGLS